MDIFVTGASPQIVYTAVWLLLALLVLLLLRLRRGIRSRREWKQRSFSRKLETILLPGEKVKQICPQKKGDCILTNKRLLLDTKDGFTAIVRKDLRKVQGQNSEGNRTTVPQRMAKLILKTDREYVLENTGAEFESLARQLLAKQKKKTKPKGK